MSSSEGEAPVTRVNDYLCEGCGKNNWVLRLGYTADGKTYLWIVCSDPACTEHLRTEHGGKETDLFLWDQLEITGQGHDLADILQLGPNEVN